METLQQRATDRYIPHKIEAVALENQNEQSRISRCERSRSSGHKEDADAVLTNALEVVLATVSTGDKVTLVGFGTLESRE